MLLSDQKIILDRGNSFFSGDAIGPSDKFIPYQWSCDDYTFLNNVGLKFIRPIDLFGVSSVIPHQDIVLMMGKPSCWKLHFPNKLKFIVDI